MKPVSGESAPSPIISRSAASRASSRTRRIRPARSSASSRAGPRSHRSTSRPPWGANQRSHLRSPLYWCSPHSVLAKPDQRPARGSSPGRTGRVQCVQPMEG